MATYTRSAIEPLTTPAATGRTQLSAKVAVMKPPTKAMIMKITLDMSRLPILLLAMLLLPFFLDRASVVFAHLSVPSFLDGKEEENYPLDVISLSHCLVYMFQQPEVRRWLICV